LEIEKISERKMGYEMKKIDDLVKKQKLENFSEVDLEIASKYSAERAYMIYKLYENQEAELDEMISKGLKSSVDKLKDILENIDFPFIEILKNMEITGVKICRNRLKNYE
jgi:DNA polymerase-1